MIPNTDIEDMTDAQDEAPMRVYLKPGLIRQAGGYPATLTFPDHPKAIEYVRADLYAALQAELEALIHDIERAKEQHTHLLAERDALQGQLDDLRNGWANSVKAHAALLAERDAAFAAGQRDMQERAAGKCRWHSDRLVGDIRALPIKPGPDGR